MGETHNHDHNHHQPPPPQAAAPPAMPLGSARGPLFPPAEQLLQLHYCIHSNPSWPQTVLLAFQHYIVMLGTTVMIATVLVPQMGGGPGDKARVIQSLLFTSGVNTLLQTLFGTRLPTVMGPSFAYIISALSVINDLSDSNFRSEHEIQHACILLEHPGLRFWLLLPPCLPQSLGLRVVNVKYVVNADRGYTYSWRFEHTMRAIHGSLIVSSFINIILGYGGAWGNLTRFFSPVVITPLVCVVGLGLFGRGFPQVGDCIEIGLPMLILLVISQQYMQRVHPVAQSILERFALLLCIGLIWAFAAILTVAGAYNHVKEQTKLSCRIDRSFLLSSAPWIKVPYPFQWGTPIFRASHVFGMMGAALVSSAESTATFYAASRLAGATPPPAHVVSRSIGLQGIGQLFDGFFGAVVGTTASVENVGLLGLTRVGSRRVVQISTAFMIFFSIFGKFGAFFAQIPLPIFAAIYCILYGIVAAIGISFIQFANKNSMRNIYVLGISLFLGISIPQYFVMNTDISGHGPVRTPAGWFNDILNTIFSSSPTVATIVGTFVDNTLEARHSVNDRGVPWLVPFQRRKGDSRNDEFYSYPLRINEYIPSRFL